MPTSEARKQYQRTYQRTYQRERKRRLRLACVNQLGGKCADCPEDDPSNLEFDHVRGKKAAHISELLRLKGGLKNPRLRRELAKCELRCLACHAVKDGRIFRDKWGEFKREGKKSTPNQYRDEVPF